MHIFRLCGSVSFLINLVQAMDTICKRTPKSLISFERHKAIQLFGTFAQDSQIKLGFLIKSTPGSYGRNWE